MQKTKTLLLLLFVISLFFPHSSQAIEYQGIGLFPGSPREDNKRSEDIFIHESEPGTTIDESVVVVNNTNSIKKIALYAADAIASHDGAFACKQKVEEKEEVATWINISENEITLEPKNRKKIPFTITVPQSIDVGEHNGCVLIQEIEGKNDGAEGITIHKRTGIRVQITIPGEMKSNLTLENFSILSRNDGNKNIHVEIINTGNVSNTTNLQIKTKNILGKEVATHGGEYSILKNEKNEWNFVFNKTFWGGIFKSNVTSSYLDPQSNTEKQITGESSWFFMWPHWTVIAGILLLLLLITYEIYKAYKKRQIKNTIQKTWARQKISKTDSIESLAEKTNTEWEIIAKVNGLKAPYSLQNHNSLILPRPKKQKKKQIKTIKSKRNIK